MDPTVGVGMSEDPKKKLELVAWDRETLIDNKGPLLVNNIMCYVYVIIHEKMKIYSE